MAETFTVKEVTGTEKPKAQLEAEVIEQAAQVVEPVVDVVEPPPVELKDEQVLDHLSKKLGKPVTSYDDLVKEKQVLKEDLPEDVATFLKYKKETGRGIEDFTKLSRDFKAMKPDDKLLEYYSIKEEGLDKEDILSMIKEFEVDEDLDTEADIKRKNREKKKTLNEADKFFEKQKETYKVPLVSSPVPDAEKEEFDAYKLNIQSAKSEQEANAKKGEWFDQKTSELFSNDFKGFEVKVKVGEEEMPLVFSPGTPDELKSLQASPLNFIKKFLDENGMLKDAAGYHKGLAFAMNPDKVAQFYFDQGYAQAKESDDKRIKNINMSVRQSPQPLVTGGFKVAEVKSPEGQNFGSALKFKVRKV
jgi:hypothetical protein